MNAEHTLVIEAARLARIAPTTWEKFLGALQALNEQTTTQCIQSPLAELPRAQGRAQATARLLGILEDCVASADKIEGKKK